MGDAVRLEPFPERIPPEMRERDVWVCWRVEYRDDKPTKVPVDPASGGRARSNDPTTWGSFDRVLEYHQHEDTDTAGIGYMFTSGGPFVGVDLDDCRNPETSDLEEWATQVVDRLDSYTYVSCSATGVHIVVRGSKPRGKNRSGDIEMYDDNRFFAVTGEPLGTADTPGSPVERQDELESVHSAFIAETDEQRTETDGVSTVDGNTRATSSGLSDEEVLDHAREAENGDKFQRLWNGDISGYASQSEADLALCNLLAFWTGGDVQQMDRLFRQSSLMREKWDETHYANGDTYGERTLQRALEGRTEFFEPGPRTADGREFELPFTPQSVKSLAGLDEDESLARLNDREKAHHVTELLRMSEDHHVLAAVPGGVLYRYDGGVWLDEGEQELRELARRSLGSHYGRNVLDEMCEFVQADVPVPRDDLGTPDRTVAVENGLLDLRSRELSALEPDHYALNQLPVEYCPDAECPRWSQFIEESVEAEMREAIQEYVGYCLLTGELPFHRVLLLVGGGSNGKSTFLRVIRALIGEENVTGFSLGDLVHSEYHVAEMFGAIANIDADVTGGIGHGGMFKKLTGGDPVAARRPYGEPYTYRPTTKQLYSANAVPDTKVDDDAFFRRWLIVEFPTEFTASHRPGPNKDPELEAELLDELPGILNWALDGLDHLLGQDGFTNEGETEDKRRRWKEWGDTVDRFIEECIDTDASGKHTSGELHDVYSAYCRRELGETPESQGTLTRRVKSLDGVRYSQNFRFNGKKQRGFKGFALTDDAPEPEVQPSAPGDRDERQSSLSQHDEYAKLREVIDASVRQSEDGLAPVEEVIDGLAPDVDRDRAVHMLDRLRSRGDLIEPKDGYINLT